MLSTPARITADVKRLCRKIGGLDEPVFVDVAPRVDSIESDCFIDVQKQAQEHGGIIQHGWIIWEWPGICVEGEFHAVWRNPAGGFIDVSRKRDAETRILFAPDQKRVFAERRVGNVRLAIGRNPLIKEWIEANERLHRFISRHMRDVPFGAEFELSGEALKLRMHAVQLERQLANSRQARRARCD